MEFSVKNVIDPRIGHCSEDGESGTVVVSLGEDAYDIEIELNEDGNKVFMSIFNLDGEKLFSINSSLIDWEKAFEALEKMLQYSSILSPVSSRHLG